MSYMLEEDMVYMMAQAIPTILGEEDWDVMATRFRYNLRVWGERVSPVALATFISAIPKEKGGPWGELRKALARHLATLVGEKEEGSGEEGREAGGSTGGVDALGESAAGSSGGSDAGRTQDAAGEGEPGCDGDEPGDTPGSGPVTIH